MYVGGLLGLTLLTALLVRSDLPAMLHAVGSTGAGVFWLVPYRLIFFVLYALGWFGLLRPYDPDRRAAPGYVLWATTVREAIDRLLPVASVGGGVAGVRLLHWRGIPGPAAGATVIMEMLLTLVCVYLFAVIGVLLLAGRDPGGAVHSHLLTGLLCSLVIPVTVALLLRYGAVFERLESLLRPLAGAGALSADAAALDGEIRACLRRGWSLLFAGALQLVALASASFEIWLVMRLFGHPVDARAALILESLTQAARNLAFIVPAGVGVQEAGFVLVGHMLGISGELALALSMVKRAREVICGVPPLLSWQVLEVRRLRHRPAASTARP